MSHDIESAPQYRESVQSHEPTLVCAVTVNWNGLDDTMECVQSLLCQSHPNLRVIVVDNASDGNDADVVATRFGATVEVVRNRVNLGCAGGYNSGIRHALAVHHPEYILAVNNDVVAHPDMVAELVDAAVSQRAGVVGPKVYYYDWKGRRDVIWSAGGTVHRWGLKIHRQRGDGSVDAPEFDDMRQVDWVSGAAVLLTRAVLEDAGYFNTWYFIGHEDIELCLAASAAGYKIVYAPRARAWHKVGASARKVGISYADPNAYFYLIRRSFPSYVYAYHIALFPLLLARWGVLFLFKSRDTAQLGRFASDMKRMAAGRGAGLGPAARRGLHAPSNCSPGPDSESVR